MWNEPTDERLARIPKLYDTEHLPLEDKAIYLHFFIGGCDWYIAEFDDHDLLWGFAILNDDLQMAEWGYVSLAEMKAIKKGWVEIDCELEDIWRIRPASEVKRICEACGWSRSQAAE